MTMCNSFLQDGDSAVDIDCDVLLTVDLMAISNFSQYLIICCE